jgi:protein translocase SecG subunit
MQDSKKGMSQTLAGGSSDNFYQKNSGRSKEAQLAKATRTAAILFFIVTLVVNVFAIYFKGDADDTGIEPAPDPSSHWNEELGGYDISNMTDDEINALMALYAENGDETPPQPDNVD